MQTYTLQTFLLCKALYSLCDYTLCKKVTIHQVTTMLTTSHNVLFPGHNHPAKGTDDPSLAGARAIIKVSGHQ